MTATLIGYARCSTDKQDLAAQRAALEKLGVAPERIYMDRGLTGANRARPGLDQALAAVRTGDTLVVPKLDRLARSVPDARAIADALVARPQRVRTVRGRRGARSRPGPRRAARPLSGARHGLGPITAAICAALLAWSWLADGIAPPGRSANG